MREVFFGFTRFERFERRLGVSRNTLTQRLGRLVHEGLLERRAYQQRPLRHEYLLTDKGRALWDVLAAMWRFGEDWLFTDSAPPPLKLTRASDGADVSFAVVDEASGERVAHDEIRVRRRHARTSGAAGPA